MKQIVRVITFRSDHPVFAGHFPGNPIVPGVCLLDAAARLAEETWGSPVITIHRAKFKGPLIPDRECCLTLSLRMDGSIEVDCRAGSDIILSGVLDRKSLPASP